MHSSTFRQPVEARLAANLSQGYTYSNGVYRPEPFVAVQGAPEGAISATATDMANFMIALLQNRRFGSQRILQAATAQEMQTQQFTNDPRVPGVPYGFDGELYLNSRRLLEKGGVVPGFASLLALLPEQHVGVFVFTILAWWGRFWSVGRRVHFTLVALAALAFAWELVYWNLLGFRI